MNSLLSMLLLHIGNNPHQQQQPLMNTTTIVMESLVQALMQWPTKVLENGSSVMMKTTKTMMNYTDAWLGGAVSMSTLSDSGVISSSSRSLSFQVLEPNFMHELFVRPLNEVIRNISNSLGVDQSAATYMFFLIAMNFPLALVLRMTRFGMMRAVLGAWIGLVYTFYTFGVHTLHSIAVPLMVYLWLYVTVGMSDRVVKYLRRSRARLAVPLVAVVFSFGYLLVCHYHRMLTDYLGWKLDFTGLQMLITLKTTAVAWNLYDGILVHDPDSKEGKGVTNPYHRTNRLERMPSLMEYFGFLFFFIPVLSGPIYEMSDYLRFIYGEYEAHDISFIRDLNNSTRERKNPPIPWLLVLKKIILALVNMVLVLQTASYFGREQLEDVIYERGDHPRELLGSSLLYKFLFSFACMNSIKFKYVVGWCWSEAALLITGFGYQRHYKSGEFSFSGAEAVDYFDHFLASNLRDVTTTWNVSVSKWLRNYVYTRVGEKPGTLATVITFIVSAIWHGVYAGYAIMWIHYALAMSLIGRLAHKKMRPYFLNDVEHLFSAKNSRLMSYTYKILSFIATGIFTSYILPPFLLLSWDNSIQFFRSMQWCGHMAFFPIYVILTMIPSRHGHHSERHGHKSVDSVSTKKNQ
ncbi:hypothetical protein C9374_010407 [Naegleria lovaniensis]|uniref:Uncharacterized protein n=1 Tax=Naegleria lovaniensis TaxID=51637 RepID=A0AA88GG39_NAELO|nr:uncharacterized protein C9374_010407 [Naegleria lovaniensis]KAG2374830.1 hypothetical protein C9374_010407 [Naegleria lovaniensis]